MTNQRIGRNLAFSLTGAGFAAAAAFLVAAMVSRALGPEGAGAYFQIVAAFTITLTLLKIGADTGLIRATAQLVALGRYEQLPRLLRTALIPTSAVAVMAALAIAWQSPLISSALLADLADEPATSSVIAALGVLVGFGAMGYVLLGAILGLGSQTAYVSILNLGLPGSRIALVGAALAIGGGSLAAVVAWSGTWPIWVMLSAAILGRLTRRALRLGRDRQGQPAKPASQSVDDLSTAAGFWRFCLGRWLAATVEILLQWIDVILVGILMSPAAAGLYAIATRVARAGQVVDNAMRVAVSPRIGALVALGDNAGLEGLFGKTSQAMLVLTLPFYVTVLIYAETILELFGEEFVAAAPVLRVLAAGMILSAAAIMLQSIILMAGRSHWQFLNKSVALAIVVLGIIALVPRLGLIGAAVAWLFALLADVSLALVQTRRLTGISFGIPRLVVLVAGVGGGIAAIGLVTQAVLGDDARSLAAHLLAATISYLVGALLAARYFGLDLRRLIRAKDE